MYIRLDIHGLTMFKFVSPHQSTPLHKAAGGGQVDTVKYLIGAGGDIHRKDDEGVSKY